MILDKPISEMSNDEVLAHIESLRKLRQEARFKPEKKAMRQAGLGVIRQSKRKFENPIQEISGELSDILGKLLADD